MTTADISTEPTGQPAQETFPYERACPFSPPRQYAELIDRRPVAKVQLATGREAWVVSGLREARQILTSDKVSSSRTHANYPFYFDAPSQMRTDSSFIAYDPPRHTEARRKVAASFTHRNVLRLRASMERTTDACIDALLAAGPPADLHRLVSLPAPMAMICDLLGVPAEDREFLQQHGERLFGGTSSQAEREAAVVEVGTYLEDLVRRKEREPGDDLISRTVAAYRAEDGDYDVRDVVNTCRMLINGGHETTANHITLGVAALLEHPEQLAALVADPSLIHAAVEELVRWLGLGDLAVPRVALEDIEIGGEVIPEGDGILVLLQGANRDPRAFDQPDRLILARGSRRHIGFGHGVHLCIGADLARLELEIVLTRLFQRVPTLRLATPVGELRTKERAIVYGVWGLDVTW
ncbi:cytochrome P450 [Streptomyces mutabilis]|uniref:cytochrome P450 n=1 Tax=Streptomyces mutabilis TaxID=67332 RepID=UPI0022BA56C6|nr:cytochrome P450 [Streptomyces mutabilis]MCZ9353812.1 cytochrome P450 [Streptomyces mutabilis]